LIVPAGAGKTITVTFNKSATLSAIWIAEFSIAGGTVAYDSGAAADGTTNPSNGPTIPVNNANELVWNTTAVDTNATGTVSPWLGVSSIQLGCGSAYILSVDANKAAGWNYSTAQWSAVGMSFRIIPPPTLSYEQEGFRFRNDDGSETSATWVAAQDTNISRGAGINTRLRMLTNIVSDPPSQRAKLQFRKVGQTDWMDVINRP
jgi:hypothetical protein